MCCSFVSLILMHDTSYTTSNRSVNSVHAFRTHPTPGGGINRVPRRVTTMGVLHERFVLHAPSDPRSTFVGIERLVAGASIDDLNARACNACDAILDDRHVNRTSLRS